MDKSLICTALLSSAILFTASACSEATETQKPNNAPAGAVTKQSNTGTTPSPVQTDPRNAKEVRVAEAEAGEAATPDAGEDAGEGSLEATVKAEKGTLKNPFTDNKDAIEEGKKLYFAYSCNGCHGGGGGGGMCPPLTNEVFVYGSEDDTLFRLIAHGSDDLQKSYGMTRIGGENVVGPMPGYMDIIKVCENDEECKKKPHINQSQTDQVWKIIAWIRTKFNGRPERRNW